MSVDDEGVQKADRIGSFVLGLRKLTEFYFQLATVLVLAGLVDATSRAHPESKKMWFAAQVTAWAVLLWTTLHIMPLVQRWMVPSKNGRIDRIFAWAMSALLGVTVAATLIEPFSALASGWVK